MGNIGQRIKTRRKELRISADDLAKKLGKDRSTIYRYEKGDIENLPLDILEPIASALETTPAYLMGWQEIEKKADTISDVVLKMKSDSEFLSLAESLKDLNAEQIASVKQLLAVFLK